MSTHATETTQQTTPIATSHIWRQLYLLGVILLVASYVFGLVDGLQRIGLVLLFAAPVVMIYVRSGLSLTDIGMSRGSVTSGLIWGSGALLIVGTAIGAAAIVQPSVLMDGRYNQGVADAIGRSFLFIPFATVIFEELVFRGLLPALLQRRFTLKNSFIVSSLGFGLWHVFSSLDVSNPLLGTGVVASVLSVAGVVVVTALAGVVFCWLRYKSGSILAPMLAHWAVNSFALIAAAITWNG